MLDFIKVTFNIEIENPIKRFFANRAERIAERKAAKVQEKFNKRLNWLYNRAVEGAKIVHYESDVVVADDYSSYEAPYRVSLGKKKYGMVSNELILEAERQGWLYLMPIDGTQASWSAVYMDDTFYNDMLDYLATDDTAYIASNGKSWYVYRTTTSGKTVKVQRIPYKYFHKAWYNALEQRTNGSYVLRDSTKYARLDYLAA